MRHIYIHGLGQTPDSWNGVLAQMKLDETPICPNLPALLRGQAATYPNLYAAFSARCDAVEGKVLLCGLSLGAVLALQYAAERPEKVAAMVLIAPQYKMPTGLLRAQNALFRLMPNRAFAQMGFGKAEFLSLCGSMAKLDFSKSLDAIRCPTLLVCGEKDTANKKAALALSKLLARAELCEIAGAGHEVNRDNPDALARNILRFISAL